MDSNTVLNEVRGALKIYDALAVILQWLITIFGIIAVGCSLAVPVFAAYLPTIWIQILSFSSTLILTLFAVFNVFGKHNDIRKAWRYLNHAYLKYSANNLELKDLVEAKNETETMLGYIDFDSALIKTVVKGDTKEKGKINEQQP